MNEIPFGEPSIRERIMTVLEERFASQIRGVEDAAVTWDVATRDVLSSDQQNAGYAVGIYDTSEKKKDLVGAVECFLNIVVEFHATLSEGDRPGTFGNALIAEVQRVATLDLNNRETDGYMLTRDIQEKGSELDITGSNPSKVSGVVVFEAIYRHRPSQPTKRA